MCEAAMQHVHGHERSLGVYVKADVQAERLGAAAHMEGLTIRKGVGAHPGAPGFLLVFHVVQPPELGKQVSAGCCSWYSMHLPCHKCMTRLVAPAEVSSASSTGYTATQVAPIMETMASALHSACHNVLSIVVRFGEQPLC